MHCQWVFVLCAQKTQLLLEFFFNFCCCSLRLIFENRVRAFYRLHIISVKIREINFILSHSVVSSWLMGTDWGTLNEFHKLHPVTVLLILVKPWIPTVISKISSLGDCQRKLKTEAKSGFRFQEGLAKLPSIGPLHHDWVVLPSLWGQR